MEFTVLQKLSTLHANTARHADCVSAGGHLCVALRANHGVLHALHDLLEAERGFQTGPQCDGVEK